MVRVSSPAKLRPWSELIAQNGDGGGSYVGEIVLVKRLVARRGIVRFQGRP